MTTDSHNVQDIVLRTDRNVWLLPLVQLAENKYTLKRNLSQYKRSAYLKISASCCEGPSFNFKASLS